MLVLSRRIGEKIVISIAGKEVVLSIVSVRDGKVRLGFEADPSIIIHREEVAGAIEEQRRKTWSQDQTKSQGSANTAQDESSK